MTAPDYCVIPIRNAERKATSGRGRKPPYSFWSAEAPEGRLTGMAVGESTPLSTTHLQILSCSAACRTLHSARLAVRLQSEAYQFHAQSDARQSQLIGDVGLVALVPPHGVVDELGFDAFQLVFEQA